MLNESTCQCSSRGLVDIAQTQMLSARTQGQDAAACVCGRGGRRRQHACLAQHTGQGSYRREASQSHAPEHPPRSPLWA